MDKLFDDKIKNIINSTLQTSKDKKIDEAFSSQQKQFNIKTDFLSSANVQNHIDLYKDYITNFNRCSAELDTVDKENATSNHSTYRSVKNDETFNMNGVYLHELYFANIADNGSQISMDTLAYMRLSRDFGSFDEWQRDFMACAKSARCGWAVTYLNMYTQSLMNCFIDLHSQNVPAGMYPVIVIDMWQHAYYKDYLKDANTYLTAMMKQLRWSVIEKRIEKADKIVGIIRGS